MWTIRCSWHDPGQVGQHLPMSRMGAVSACADAQSTDAKTMPALIAETKDLKVLEDPVAGLDAGLAHRFVGHLVPFHDKQ